MCFKCLKLCNYVVLAIHRGAADLWMEADDDMRNIVTTVRGIREARGLEPVDKNAERKLRDSYSNLVSLELKMGPLEKIKEALRMVGLDELREGGEYIYT